MSAYDVKAKAEYINLGLGLSLLLHALLVLQIFAKTSFQNNVLPPKVIYSVSVESGKSLGGIAQLPDPKNKAEIAPPKKAVEKKVVPPITKKEEVVIPKKKEEPVQKKEVITEPKKEEVVVKKEEVKKDPLPEKKAEEAKKSTDVKKEDPKKQKKEVVKEENYEEALQKYLGESTNAGGQGFGSAGAGGKGLGGGVVKSPAWFKYKEELETLIKKGWNWHDPASSLIATVVFKISPEGEISDVRIMQSSGDTKYDDSALRAVNKASPVPAALPEIYEDFKEVILDFEPGSF